jgi:uncharacterized membrane protein SpoIIM required for sporulation
MSYIKEDRFISENSGTWRELEALSARIRSGGLQKIDSRELDTFYFLYNRACGHLSQARTNYRNSELVSYLNRLVESCHSLIYTTKSSKFKSFLRFFTRDFPLHTWENRYFLLVSFLIFAAASVFSYILTIVYPDNAAAFLPKEMLESINFDNKSQMWDSPIMSSYILTNNIRVGFTAFALGVTLGAGTVWVLISNAFLLGALGAFAQQSGHGFLFWSLILPHGVPELFAIFMCGAAGLIIGYSLINPGQYSRKDSFIKGGKSAIKLIGGTIPIFIVAGLIEGFFTPLPIQPGWKYLFSIVITVLTVFYFVFSTMRSRDASTT